MSRWPPKNSEAKRSVIQIDTDFAPSVDEADAILARFGYVEREVAVAA